MYTCKSTVLLLILTSFMYGSYAAETDACTTPRNETGVCINLRNCKRVMKLLEESNTLNSTERNYLFSLQCGSGSGFPKICCIENSVETNNSSANSSLPDRSICGTSTSYKLLGGIIAALDEYPWIARLKYKTVDNGSSFECSGSLINEKYILTAAHCVKDYMAENWKLTRVSFGEYDTASDLDCINITDYKDCLDRHKDIEIEEVIAHENYTVNSSIIINDIALLRLKNKINYTEFISPICLQQPNEEIAHNLYSTRGYISGRSQHKRYRKLRINVQIIPNQECKQNFTIKLNKDQICILEEIQNYNADDGGPLMIYNLNKHLDVNIFALGIKSYSLNHLGIKIISVYTNINSYMDWIVSKIQE